MITKKQKASQPSLSSSRTIRKTYRPPSSRRQTFGDGTKQYEAPLSAVQIAEMAIQEVSFRSRRRFFVLIFEIGFPPFFWESAADNEGKLEIIGKQTHISTYPRHRKRRHETGNSF